MPCDPQEGLKMYTEELSADFRWCSRRESSTGRQKVRGMCRRRFVAEDLLRFNTFRKVSREEARTSLVTAAPSPGMTLCLAAGAQSGWSGDGESGDKPLRPTAGSLCLGGVLDVVDDLLKRLPSVLAAKLNGTLSVAIRLEDRPSKSWAVSASRNGMCPPCVVTRLARQTDSLI